ncbi:MAG: helix-turn-helix domain-containing protein [Bacilli bacterium]|nr:helix-turn-helix domain-containing protein [Bacilli bacterium]
MICIKDFIIIPRRIMEDNSLTKSDCFLFGNIYNLSRLNGYCFATNKVLSTLSFVKIRTINYSLKRLENKGYIRIERVKNSELVQRRIYIEDMKIDSS